MMSFATIDEALHAGLSHHQAGRLQQAEKIYREVLAQDQNCVNAWYLLGTLALQAGHSEVAAQMLERALQLGMRTPEIFNNLGECHRILGRPQDAAGAYQSAIELDSNHVEALINLGMLYNGGGHFPQALPLLEKAVRIRPESAPAHYNYAITLASLGRIGDAVRHWEITVQIQPGHSLAMRDLGLALYKSKQYDKAIEVLKKLIAQKPRFLDGYVACGEAQAASGKYEDAISTIRKAIELEPNRAELYDMLGIFYSYAERFEESLEASQHAVRIDPGFFNAMVNAGVTYRRLERFDEAIHWFERAAELQPGNLTVGQALFSCYANTQRCDKAIEASNRILRYHPNHAHIHFDYAAALLAMGRYLEGFKEYEWRWQCKKFGDLPQNFEGPRWDTKTTLNGKTIFLYCEQGYGDIIQFARYIPMVIEQGARVIVGVPWDIRPIIESIPGIEKIVYNLDPSQLPDYDMHFPLMSLAWAFKTTLETVPGTPYLQADATRVEKWKPRIESHAQGLKVGLVWGGSPSPEPRRTCSIKELSILADVPNISWYSLQTDEHREKLKDAPSEMNILDLGRDFTDFADAAAVMSQLDLMITIDTASANLAGALGVKTWAMIIHSPDWRWGLEGDSTPWYPTLRLFRQRARHDWPSVVEKIREELMQLTRGAR